MDSCASGADLGLVFNDPQFSDVILVLEIIPDSPESPESGGDGRVTKRRRKEDVKKDSSIPQSEEILAHDNQGKESGDDDSAVLRANTIHISSAILAGKSPFFYKLFSNGMKETVQRRATLRIHEREEAALMELLKFMYSGRLSTAAVPALLDMFMVADKFEVTSCMRYCSTLLQNLPMTNESALQFLELPSIFPTAEEVQPLSDAANKYLAGQYGDISEFPEEVLSMPLAAIEAIFSSDDLQVPSEDAVAEFLIRWVRLHYPQLDQRREVMGKRLISLIRLPFLSSQMLMSILTCDDLEEQQASKIVLAAMFAKCQTPYCPEEWKASQFVERSHKWRPIKVVYFELPMPQCIVYMDLKREECSQLFPEGKLNSEAFIFGGQQFMLSGRCSTDQPSSSHCFGLYLEMPHKGSVSLVVDYMFAGRSKPNHEFVNQCKGKYTSTGGISVGYQNMFRVPWTAFMDDASPYFINDILHLRAELSLLNQ